MQWVGVLSEAIGYIERNLTNEIRIEDIAAHVYVSSANFQRVFRLITGITVGEHIRNRRLTMAGQELMQGSRKIVDIAVRYQYDTQESFSKAFSRFHGIAPSGVFRKKTELKVYNPLTVNVKIQGGFEMARTLIHHVPVHPLQYPHQGQNYVFNGCMKFLMECIGEENQAYDYWFFSAVSGDCYVQVFNANKNKWSTCLSQSKFDYDLLKCVFDAVGYNFTYLDAPHWQKDRESLGAKLKDYIDRGDPGDLEKGFIPCFRMWNCRPVRSPV